MSGVLLRLKNKIRLFGFLQDFTGFRQSIISAGVEKKHGIKGLFCFL